MKLKDRIKGLERIPARDLLPHPRNWRTHPREQRDALRGILAEVGIADALLVRETPDGYQILDGHCRAEEAPDVEWPCLVVDLSDAEAEKLLVTHDPIGAMAEADAETLRELLAGVESDSEAVQKLLGALEDNGAAFAEIEVLDGDDGGQRDGDGNGVWNRIVDAPRRFCQIGEWEFVAPVATIDSINAWVKRQRETGIINSEIGTRFLEVAVAHLPG